MINKIKNIVLFVLCFAITGCVTYKADSSGISSPDYNQRVRVTDPHYDGVLNPIGITGMAATTIGTGYLAYNSNLIKINDGPNQTTSQIGNAVIGAAVGFGASYLVNKWLGWGKVKPMYSYNKQEWVKRANKNYLYLSNYDYLTVMPKSIEPTFKILKNEDMKDFSEAFNNSTYSDSVVHRAIPQLNRDELLLLIKTFPSVSTIKEAKIQYILQSKSLENIFASKELFKDVELNIEKPASELISSLSDAKLFFKYYPKSAYSNIVESKSAKLINDIDDCSNFKLLFPFSIFAPSIINKLSNSLNRQDLPVLVNLYLEIPEIEQTKIQYIKTSNTATDFFEAISKYPIKSLLIQKRNYSENINACKKTIEDFEEKSSLLGYDNVSRLIDNVKNEFLSSRLSKNTNKSDYYQFNEVIKNNSWLQPQADKYLSESFKNIAKINENENNQARINEFNIAKIGSISDLLRFCNKYPGSNEASSASGLINHFVSNHVVQAIDPFKHEAKGDRTFGTAWAEGMRDYVKGAENYNIFILGRIRNTSKEKLTVRLTVTLHLIKLTNLSIFSNSSAEDHTEYYYATLYPNDEIPYATMYKNVSGGTQIGRGLLSAGTSRGYADNPISVEAEFYPNEISNETIKQQRFLIKALLTNGNVETKDWGGTSISQLFGKGSGECQLNVNYSSEWNNPVLSIYNENDELIESKEWNSSGRNIGVFYLKKGRYKVKVSDCDGFFNVNVNAKTMSFTVKKCKSEEYRESK
ncbi:MAG: hypothetical protein WCK78_00400 [Paludibacter sp.]